MPVKISTLSQLELLQEGDILQRFPSQGAPEVKFDETRCADIDTYEIKSINRKAQAFQLVMNDALGIFAWPGDIERLNIKLASMLVENKWWIS